MMEGGALYHTTELRRANRNRVFRAIYRAPQGVTKQELANALSMSQPTLIQNLKELTELGLVDGSAVGDSSGGRKPRLLTADPRARWAVGVEISSRHLRLVAVDLRLEELRFRTVDRPFRAGEEYARFLARTVEDFIAGTGLDRKNCLGVGVTVPGIVEDGQKTVADAPTLGVRRMNGSDLVGAIPYPVCLVNDANAGGHAESWGRTDGGPLAYLSLGRGVGGAVLLPGGAYLGATGRSGEFGHMCIHPGGAQCGCGRRGCLEAYCSTARLSDDLDMTLEEFFRGVDRGETELKRRWDAYLDDLSLGLSNIRAALDCPIVLGGKLSPYLTDARLVALEMRLVALDPEERPPGLSVCRYHDRANGVGAAAFLIDKFLQEL